MKDYLTISETAELLGTTPFNIRYYEKEGIKLSSKKSDKGYRLFDFEDLYKLSSLLMLREANIPIKDIRDLFKDYNVETYKSLMRTSSKSLNEQITRLKQMKRRIDGIIEEFDEDLESFSVRTLQEQKLLFLRRCDFNESLTERDLYNLALENSLVDKSLYKLDIYVELDRDKQSYFIPVNDMKVKNDAELLTLHEGDYAVCYVSLSDDNLEEELSKAIDQFLRDFTERSLTPDSSLFLRLMSSMSFLESDVRKGVYELCIKMK